MSLVIPIMAYAMALSCTSAWPHQDKPVTERVGDLITASGLARGRKKVTTSSTPCISQLVLKYSWLHPALGLEGGNGRGWHRGGLVQESSRGPTLRRVG